PRSHRSPERSPPAGPRGLRDLPDGRRSTCGAVPGQHSHDPAVGARIQRAKRALHVGRVARRRGLLRVLREIGVVGQRPATREGAREFRRALEELGTTYVKLGQLLSSRPDLLPDVYVDELAKLVD